MGRSPEKSIARGVFVVWFRNDNPDCRRRGWARSLLRHRGMIGVLPFGFWKLRVIAPTIQSMAEREPVRLDSRYCARGHVWTDGACWWIWSSFQRAAPLATNRLSEKHLRHLGGLGIPWMIWRAVNNPKNLPKFSSYSSLMLPRTSLFMESHVRIPGAGNVPSA